MKRSELAQRKGEPFAEGETYLEDFAEPIRDVVEIAARAFGIADASQLCGNVGSDESAACGLAIVALRRYLLMSWEGVALVFGCSEAIARRRFEDAFDALAEHPEQVSALDEIRGALGL